MKGTESIHVAVGAIFNERGQVLIARRPARAHQGGLWEFPGGKVLPGETVPQALRRELSEEVGIVLQEARPLIRIAYAYPERHVVLDVWRGDRFEGVPWGREGQPVRWAHPADLDPMEFPAANAPIINAVRLPALYAVSGEPQGDPAAFLARLDAVLAAGVTLVQLRAKGLAEGEYLALAVQALARCRRAGARLLLNAPAEWVERVGADGVHLTAARLMACTARPLPPERWVAASCHSLDEVAHARRIGADFIVAGPVQATASHPGVPLLGWDGLAAVTAAAALPVYALGGLSPEDLSEAWRHGAQGIAAISALWHREAGSAQSR